MGRPLILSTCTKRKAHNGPAIEGGVFVRDFLGDKTAIARLEGARALALGLPGTGFSAQGGELYAIDRYVRSDNDYGALFPMRDAIRAALRDGSLGSDWFFLSGGYGLVHALEPIRSYNATFLHVPDAPFTGEIWADVLPSILDEVFTRLRPSEVLGYFRDNEYRDFVRRSQRFKCAGDCFHLELPFSDLEQRCKEAV